MVAVTVVAQLSVFLTKGGKRVIAQGQPTIDTVAAGWKVLCYYADTGGLVGMLKLENLTPVGRAARTMLESHKVQRTL